MKQVSPCGDTNVRAIDDAPTALYRFYDGQGRLLYVGITTDIGSRFRQHEKQKTWWIDVRSITVEPFPDRGQAEDAERAAVRGENPLWNERLWAPGDRRNKVGIDPNRMSPERIEMRRQRRQRDLDLYHRLYAGARDRREAVGISRAAFCREARMTYQQLRGIEDGTTTPGVDVLQRWSEAMQRFEGEHSKVKNARER